MKHEGSRKPAKLQMSFFSSFNNLNNSTALSIYIFCTILVLMAFVKIFSKNQRQLHSVKNLVDTFIKSRNYKMVIVVRTDVAMGKGKLAAQVNF